MQTGIYKITCTANGHVYIGQCVDFLKRKRKHLAALRANCHCNQRIQRTFNKYGEDTFEFDFLFTCSREELTTLEQNTLQAYLKENTDIVMNLILAVAGNWKHSEETKQKLSAFKKGKPGHSHTDSHKELMKNQRSCKSCSLISPEGEVCLFKSISEASRVTGITYRNIWKVVNKQRSHAGNWRFHEETRRNQGRYT